jgi:hypothetical protein
LRGWEFQLNAYVAYDIDGHYNDSNERSDVEHGRVRAESRDTVIGRRGHMVEYRFDHT